MTARLISGLLLVIIIAIRASGRGSALPDFSTVSNEQSSGRRIRPLCQVVGAAPRPKCSPPGDRRQHAGGARIHRRQLVVSVRAAGRTALGALTQNIAQDRVALRCATLPLDRPHRAHARHIQYLAHGTKTSTISRIMFLPGCWLAVLGARFKLVRGYPGTKDAHLALERGKVESFQLIDLVKTMWGDWLQDKQIKVVVQQSLESHPDLPDVPTLLELGKTAAKREVISLTTARRSDDRSWRRRPAACLPCCGAGFDATVRDEQLLAEDVRQGGLRWRRNAYRGNQCQGIARATVNLRPDERGQSARDRRFNP